MWFVWKSRIHGVGIYTTKLVNKNQVIDIAIDKNNKITLFGSKLNHSFKPNSMLMEKNKVFYVVANQIIKPYTEITVNYNNTPPFIAKVHNFHPPLK
jgi:alanine dehydrogenase